jgi:DNA-binding transcriptional regulator GbsR (MarR family)
MASPSFPEPTLTDIVNQLKELKTDFDQRLDKVDERLDNLDQRMTQMDYKFDTYEKASDKVYRLATTIIVAAATVAVLPSAFQAIGPLISSVVIAGQ